MSIVGQQIKTIAEKIVLNLNELEIGAYIYHEALSSNSVYIRFSDARIGSIRISDHNTRKYSYKYEIRTDITHSGKWVKNEHWTYVIGAKFWEKIIDEIIGRQDFVSRYTQKREYYTPEHKAASQPKKKFVPKKKKKFIKYNYNGYDPIDPF